MTPAEKTPPGPILLCTDGSAPALEALRAGLDLVDRDARLLLVTVVPEADLMAVTGTGMAGGTMSPEEFDRLVAAGREEAGRAIDEARTSLGLGDVEAQVLEGDAGAAICGLADELGARAIVVGTRGHGQLRRAVLGSVSDHLVRRAPCPVVVSRGGVADD